MIIAFAGRIRTGKTSHARAVASEKLFWESWGGKPGIRSFAGAIKREAAENCGFSEELAWSQAGKDTLIYNQVTSRRETVREAILDWVTRRRAEDSLAFVKVMRDEIEKHLGLLSEGLAAGPFIIDDVRMPEEVDMLAEYPAACIFKCLPGADWTPDANACHPTETALDDWTGFPCQRDMKRLMENLHAPSARMCLHLPKIRKDGTFAPLDKNVENILFIHRMAMRDFLGLSVESRRLAEPAVWKEYADRVFSLRTAPEGVAPGSPSP